MIELCCIIIGWFIGGFINGMAGFGAAMVAMPLIAPFIDFSVAVPSCVLIVLTLNCHVGWTFRKYIDYKYLKGIFWGAIPGTILSLMVLEYISERHLKIGMGGFITLYALWGLFAETEARKTIHAGWGYLAGVLSSTFGMAFGFNGPPLAAFAAYCGCPAKAVKGILGAGFVITGVFIVSGKVFSGQITPNVLLIFAASTPAVLLGSKLGIRASSYLSEVIYRKFLFMALAAMGGNIIFAAL